MQKSIKLSTKIKEVNAIVEYTVELVLTDVYYPALVELSMTRPYVFISPKVFKDGRTKDGVNGYRGTGPYILKEHKTDEYAVFEAHDQYWGDLYKFQQIQGMNMFEFMVAVKDKCEMSQKICI